jgi:AraC-like DNA-binding protein
MLADAYAHSPLTLMHIAEQLRLRGVSPVDVFRRIDVPPSLLLDQNRWVPRALCLALSNEVNSVVDDRYFSAGIGFRFRFSDFGTWGKAILDAETVGEACAVAAKGVGLLHQGSEFQFVPVDGHAELRFSYRGNLGANPRPHLGATLAVLRKIPLLADEPEAVSVHFAAPYTLDAERFEETHGSRLEFGQDHDAIVIDREILDAPLKSETGKRRVATEPAETAAGLQAVLKQLLPYGKADIRTVAVHQNMSRRTLQRRLKDWGFTFEEILDDIRRSEALMLVRTGTLPMIEVAFLLGYSDPAHFSRAFRRWTGVTPSDYRRAQLAA